MTEILKNIELDNKAEKNLPLEKVQKDEETKPEEQTIIDDKSNEEKLKETNNKKIEDTKIEEMEKKENKKPNKLEKIETANQNIMNHLEENDNIEDIDNERRSTEINDLSFDSFESDFEKREVDFTHLLDLFWAKNHQMKNFLREVEQKDNKINEGIQQMEQGLLKNENESTELMEDNCDTKEDFTLKKDEQLNQIILDNKEIKANNKEIECKPEIPENNIETKKDDIVDEEQNEKNKIDQELDKIGFEENLEEKSKEKEKSTAKENSEKTITENIQKDLILEDTKLIEKNAKISSEDQLNNNDTLKKEEEIIKEELKMTKECKQKVEENISKNKSMRSEVIEKENNIQIESDKNKKLIIKEIEKKANENTFENEENCKKSLEDKKKIEEINENIENLIPDNNEIEKVLLTNDPRESLNIAKEKSLNVIYVDGSKDKKEISQEFLNAVSVILYLIFRINKN